jgi:hypothetical protein
VLVNGLTDPSSHVQARFMMGVNIDLRRSSRRAKPRRRG